MKFTKISLLALSFAAALGYAVAMEPIEVPEQPEMPAPAEEVMPEAPTEVPAPAEEVMPEAPAETSVLAEEANPVEVAMPEAEDQDTEDFFKDLMIDDEEAK